MSSVRAVPVLLILAAGCGGFDPGAESTDFQPPAVYRQWWAETEACAGRRGDFARIRWIVVHAPSFDCPSGRCVGRWEATGEIYLARDWVGHEMVVRHEMLHALIGEPGHPDPPFRRGCSLTWDSWRGDPGVSFSVVTDAFPVVE